MPRKPAGTENMAPLEAIRLMLKKQAINLKPIVNQISALPKDKELEYYFVPAEYMKLYKAYERPGKPYKNLKLVNYERPAVSLSFYSKHKYKLERHPDPTNVERHLRQYRAELLDYSMNHQLSINQQNELQHTDQIIRELRENPQAYQACFSNYHHYYQYWYCTFRYFKDNTLLQLDSDNEHLLKHITLTPDKIQEKINIIFIDTAYISKPVPYDNRFVDRELAGFPTQIRQGITTLYIRKVE